ncbi:hypothetical protein TPA0910_64540 [Streptomyces hygroscopicus subsp. sporocinereus]|uniref:Uncharacterized protein n=1 Tax=Streptomyces hygroscopicus TaxID=1912 RepID=A0ABQ3U8U2_STRHY|nr:hypothetical protein TPA0910_64540 [Streptomyces hygroscopicus]
MTKRQGKPCRSRAKDGGPTANDPACREAVGAVIDGIGATGRVTAVASPRRCRTRTTGTGRPVSDRDGPWLRS